MAIPKKVFVQFDSGRPNGVTRLESEAEEWVYHNNEVVYEYVRVEKVVISPERRKKLDAGED